MEQNNVITLNDSLSRASHLIIYGANGPIVDIDTKDGTVEILQLGKEPEAANNFWKCIYNTGPNRKLEKI